MNKYAQEVLTLGGKNILAVMQKDFPQGFFIVASDTERFVVGNGEKNLSYSRKTGKVLETCIFSSKVKLSRKGV